MRQLQCCRRCYTILIYILYSAGNTLHAGPNAQMSRAWALPDRPRHHVNSNLWSSRSFHEGKLHSQRPTFKTMSHEHPWHCPLVSRSSYLLRCSIHAAGLVTHVIKDAILPNNPSSCVLPTLRLALRPRVPELFEGKRRRARTVMRSSARTFSLVLQLTCNRHATVMRPS